MHEGGKSGDYKYPLLQTPGWQKAYDVVLYNVACNLAVLGDTEKALDYLEQAADHGAVSAAWMRNDEDLVRLRDDPRYIALLDRADGKCT